MIGFAKHRFSPIGVDLGRRSVKLLQLSGDLSRVTEAARWDLPADAEGADAENRHMALTEGVRQLCKSRNFRGREAVLCLGGDQLFAQNIRVARGADAEVSRLVTQEAAARIPYSIAEAEVRYLETTDIRQGDAAKREVVLLACHRPLLERQLKLVEEAGLQPVAVDVEPVALLRCYSHQSRRDEDRLQRAMFVHVGQSNSVVVIAQGKSPLFVKYVDIGGCHFDQAVATHLDMTIEAAAMLRRHNGDRRSEQQDPEIAHSVGQAIRPIVERLGNELSLCVRYHSVTFRGQPLTRMVLGGGEASATLTEYLSQALDLPCQLGEPLRTYKSDLTLGRQSQWDVVAGLALRNVE
ncbi:MAG: type IV pilus assembly protein PilM [Planctomycetes bacterium]|nr:type IV pilus assembly protein PilM [Planctomycetota bacterium]